MIDYAGRNPRTVNFFKTLYFHNPDWVEANVSIMMATWIKYRDEVEDIVLRHPKLFPEFRKKGKGSVNFDFPDAPPLYSPGFHTDCWGTVWENIEKGLDSIAVEHPLDDWAKFDDWTPPDPERDAEFGVRDWDAVKKSIDADKAAGGRGTGGGLMHGFFYMRLFYLRGFENLMMDFGTGEPKLRELIKIVEDYCVHVTQRYLDLGAEFMGFGEDLGNQTALPISPAMWREWIKPSYEAIIGPCRDRDIPVYLHSDGHILPIIPDLMDVGVTMINPQIRANGLEGLKQLRGKIAIHLDLDRQLFPFASKQEIVDHIGEAFEALYLPEGGLSLNAECEPDVSLENIETICSTLEDICNIPDPDDVE